MSDLDLHCKGIIKALVSGRVVPFLGAGVNLCGRPEDARWLPRQATYLPSGGELAEYLAESFAYPASDTRDLLRVSQYVAEMNGAGPLYEELHTLFDADYPPTSLHRFLATLPATLRAKGYPPRHQLIITTNYDDLMERALAEANEPFEVVSYVADGDLRGKFLHTPPTGEPRPVDKPSQYLDVSVDQRTVVLKIHGAVCRGSAERAADSFVITEDHYIDYLTRTELSGLVPIKLVEKLKHSHFLFLGYGLRDWNLRVILHRIAGEQKLNYKSWAIQLKPDPLDRKFWLKRDVDIFDVDLGTYIAQLASLVQALPVQGAEAPT